MGIQSPPIWSEQCSIHLLKTPEAGSIHTEEAWNQIDPLSRRYADNGKKQGGSKKILSYSIGATGGARVYNQPEKEHPHTNTGVGISWFPAEFLQHDHWATNSQASSPEEDGEKNDGLEEDNTAGASLPSRNDGSGSSGNPTSSSALQTSRECQIKGISEWPYIRGRFGYQSQHGARSGMVAKQLQPAQWETLADRAVGSDNRIRCVQKGAGEPVAKE